jgi:hypothetical protein
MGIRRPCPLLDRDSAFTSITSSDPRRSMIARFRPASDVPVDAGRLQAPGERRREQEIIDAKALQTGAPH